MSDALSAGRLEDQPFPALAGRIFREGRTGGLTLESGERRRTVWFLGGNPAAVVSADPEDHIARFLLEHGHINEAEHARLAALPETRDSFAAADFLPKDALNWGVKFRFVSLCYDLFRWEEGDYSFAEGHPPRELFLLKVPANSLIFKGIGYLGRARLLDLVPDDAVLAAGETQAGQARYLGPVEQGALDACRPGRTVAEVLAAGGLDDPEQARALVYALACLGLVSFAAAAGPRRPATQEDDAAFALEEPVADADSPPPAAAFEPAAASFELPPLGSGAGEASRESLEAALAAASSASGKFSFEEGPPGGGLGSFDDSFTAETAEPPPASSRKAAPRPRKEAARPAGGPRLARLAGIALGAVAASAVLVGAAWWLLVGEEPPPPPPVKPFAKKASPQAPAAPAPVPAAVQPAAPVASAPPAAPAPAPTPPAPPRAVTAPPAQQPTAPPGDRYLNGLDVFRAGDLDGAAAIWEDLLALQHRNDFTLLLLTACQRETIRDAQKTLAARRLHLVPKKVDGRSCFRVCVDTFGTRDEAARALATLPAEFRAAGAAVRPVADVLANR